MSKKGQILSTRHEAEVKQDSLVKVLCLGKHAKPPTADGCHPIPEVIDAITTVVGGNQKELSSSRPNTTL
ncbi:hypothetical protein EVAR_65688_1 [Eumeta japonica]|uniref:Uncharacterized protein n=1 Tax=Eumeta variegata TaxID=151549 RepID=A0A4C1ZAC3_EUMVA|nr:hypothetical protein EVAR_65688_1 [Eumeta japonica]